ncbi:MAG: PEP-CTERM sorting domain-containing protein [Fuerstiella sp.]
MIRRSADVLLVLACLALSATANAGVLLTSNNVRAEFFSDGEADRDTYTGTGFPASHHVAVASGVGVVASEIQVDHNQTAGGETLSYAFDLHRTANELDFAQAANVDMSFTVDANTTYDLSGEFHVRDYSRNAGRVYFEAYLWDQTASSYVFSNRQQSINTLNESLLLGGTAGDVSNNSLIGSLTGTLEAGHTYLFLYVATVQALDDDGAGARGAGFVTLEFADAAQPVPEPASVAMWGLGILGLTCCRRRGLRRQVVL